MAGIYIHIPFCKQKCSYCDFHFSTTYSAYREKMIQALVKEIKMRKNYLKNKTIETIYFGGGTPSLLTHEELELILKSVYKTFSVASQIEFTLEANPDDITSTQLNAWKSLGINRLSIGIQSFFQEDLDWMNRAHTVEQGINAVQLTKENDFFITTDLIYGLPNHTIQKLDTNINQLLQLEPHHISAYCLTVEKGTALDYMIRKKMLPRVGEEEQADEFEYLVKRLSNAGYEQYEISNFAKNQAYSVHNSNYWRGINYIGIGPSAHSFDGDSRQWNVANNHQYIKTVLHQDKFFEQEILSQKDKFNELILTGLRTKWGASLTRLNSYHLLNDSFLKQLQDFKDEKLIFEENHTLYLTQKGKLQGDYVSAMLFLE